MSAQDYMRGQLCGFSAHTIVIDENPEFANWHFSQWYECQNCGYMGKMRYAPFDDIFEKKPQCPQCSQRNTYPIWHPKGTLLVDTGTTLP